MRGVLLMLLVAGTVCAQQGTGDLPVPAKGGERLIADTSVEFAMVPRMETASPYVVTVEADGRGSVRFERDPAGVTVPIAVRRDTWLRLGRGAAAVDERRCGTKLKKIAETGKKTISYVPGPASPRSCSFDYSDDEGLMDSVAAFQAIVETLHYGQRLRHEHRFDRLSLDAEMQSLTAAVAAGRAIEVQNIGATLKSLVEDERVIDRVRRAAARLLEKGKE